MLHKLLVLLLPSTSVSVCVFVSSFCFINIVYMLTLQTKKYSASLIKRSQPSQSSVCIHWIHGIVCRRRVFFGSKLFIIINFESFSSTRNRNDRRVFAAFNLQMRAENFSSKAKQKNKLKSTEAHKCLHPGIFK